MNSITKALELLIIPRKQTVSWFAICMVLHAENVSMWSAACNRRGGGILRYSVCRVRNVRVLNECRLCCHTVTRLVGISITSAEFSLHTAVPRAEEAKHSRVLTPFMTLIFNGDHVLKGFKSSVGMWVSIWHLLGLTVTEGHVTKEQNKSRWHHSASVSMAQVVPSRDCKYGSWSWDDADGCIMGRLG